MTDETTESRSCWLLAALLIMACALQSVETRFRGIDPDEFEHLHAAYMVHRGEVPYRDFFEHHGPALYYLLQPLFWWRGAAHSVLWLARLVSCSCALGILWLTWRIAERLNGRPAGLVAVTLLAWTTIFQAKGIELRPDVPAALLITGCLALALGESVRWQRWLTIGILAGLATLFTQKSIVPIAGITLAACARSWCRREWRTTLLIPLAIGAGGALTWGIAATVFAAADAQGAFFHGAIEQLLVWPVRSRRWEQLRPTLVAEPVVWIAGLVAAASAWRPAGERNTQRDARRFVSVAAIVSVSSLIWVKATYAQFYLLWFPWVAVLAGCQLVDWSRRDVRRSSLLAAGLIGTLAIAVQGALGGRAFSLQTQGALPHLTAALWQAGIAPTVFLVLFLVVAALGLWWCVQRHRWQAVVTIVAAMGMFHAVLRGMDGAVWSNAEQIRRMSALETRVGADGTVFDGYSGFGALRPHAYFYWWINEYSLALMKPAERDEELLAALQEKPPAVVLFDSDLARLPDSVTGWIRAHYEPLEGETWLWVPKGDDVRGD